jgi:hypothetical protein
MGRVEQGDVDGLQAARNQPFIGSRHRFLLLADVGAADFQEPSADLHWPPNITLRLGGLNPFDNSRRRYQGSDDDAALNAGIERFSADPRALARLAYDADLSGLIVLPTVTVHALHDPTIPFVVEADYARVVQAAGRSELLVQTATDEAPLQAGRNAVRGAADCPARLGQHRHSSRPNGNRRTLPSSRSFRDGWLSLCSRACDGARVIASRSDAAGDGAGSAR